MNDADAEKIKELYGDSDSVDAFTRDFGDVKSSKSVSPAKSEDAFERDFGSAPKELTANIPVATKIAMEFQKHPEDFTPLGAVKNFAGSMIENAGNALTSAKDFSTMNYEPGFTQASKDLVAKRNAGTAETSDYSNALLSEVGNSPGGKMAGAVAGLVPGFNLVSTGINKLVNPAIEATTGIAPSNLDAAELVGGTALGAKFAPKGSGKSVVDVYRDYKSQGVPPSVSDNLLTRAIGGDNATPDTVNNKLADMGPDAMAADAAGENTRGLARAVGNMPGPAREMAIEALEERQAGQSDRLTQAVTQGLSVDPKATTKTVVDKLVSDRETAAAPLYKDAFDVQNVYNDRIGEFLADPDVKTGIARGLKIQRLESLANGEKFDPNDYGITGFNEAGDPIISGTPNMRLLDAAKKGLDAQIADNTDPVTGKVNELGRALTKTKKSYVSELDKSNPKYAEARQSFSGPSQSIDAINSGKDFISNGGEINTDIIKNLSDNDKPFFRIGVAQKISDILQNTPDGADAVKRIFGTKAKRNALKSVFPDEESFSKFEKTVNDEKDYTKTYHAVTRGSRTAPMAGDIADTRTGFNKAVEAGANIAGHGAALAQRNILGKAVYGGGLLMNKLTQGKPLSEGQSVMLANKLFTPKSQQGVNPIPQIQPRTSLVGSYINHLMSGSTNPMFIPPFSPATQPVDNSQ